MPSVLPGLTILGAAALIALLLAFWRRPQPDQAKERQAASRAFSATVAVQAVHFTEELVTGFPVAFPALFGLPPVSYTYFIVFNLAWLAIWVASIPGLRLGQRATYFAAWFLGIAGIINGLGHPALAIYVKGYFPGLLSAPLIGVAGAW
ncbi:MAG: HXXEE domain-containing protein, partial [Woeseiaceae bacterium]